MSVTIYDTGEAENGNRTTDSSAWSIETVGPHVATVEASARADVTARAKNVPTFSIADPIASAVLAIDERMRLPPRAPDAVSSDFAIPISFLVPEIRFLCFFCGLPTTAFDDSAPRQQSDAPMAEDSARYRYRWERITELATSAGDIWIPPPRFFWKPYGAMICVLRRHIRMTR